MELRELTVTLERQAELSEAERLRLNRVLSSMRDALIAVSSTGAELLRNPAFDRLSTHRELVLEEEGGVVTQSALPLLLQRTAQGETFTAQLRSVDQEGNRHWLEAVGQPFTEREEGGLLVIRDITERSLRRLQEEFVAILAHELRTPLTALQGYLQHLATNPADAERLGRLSIEQLERMRQLIGDLFDTARIESGTMSFDYENVALRRLLNDSVDIAQSLTQRQRIDFEPADGQIVVRADPKRLQQVILNLLTNAITHAPDSERIGMRLRAADGFAVVEIEDEGPGVPEQQVQTLFERFRSPSGDGSSPGLGLGLFISRQIVTAHGGTIEAESGPGRGLTVRVRLPMPSDGRRSKG
jgi:two-component system CheB/CheR fusion protein